MPGPLYGLGGDSTPYHDYYSRGFSSFLPDVWQFYYGMAIDTDLLESATNSMSWQSAFMAYRNQIEDDQPSSTNVTPPYAASNSVRCRGAYSYDIGNANHSSENGTYPLQKLRRFKIVFEGTKWPTRTEIETDLYGRSYGFPSEIDYELPEPPENSL